MPLLPLPPAAPRSYPHLVGFFEALGVETEPSEMSFALSVDGGRVEWGSHGLDALFAQRANALSPSFLAMVRDVIKFGQEAPEVSGPGRAWGAAGPCWAGCVQPAAWHARLAGLKLRAHQRAWRSAAPSQDLSPGPGSQCTEWHVCRACAAHQVLRPENKARFAGMTLGQYLNLRGYSEGFKYNYVLPMCACVWSVPNVQVGLGRWTSVEGGPVGLVGG